jgi:hypothetical protein
MWMTESGVMLNARPGKDLTPAQQAVQARYLVRATVLSLAAGTGKQFWFGAPPIHDEGVYFGLLSRDFQPWPAYSAHAALTSLLGEACFLERLSDSCHVFAAGSGRRVTVVWGPPAEVEIPVISGGTAEVYDIMGRRVGSVGPEGRVKVSEDPVYVVQEGVRDAVPDQAADHHPVPRDLSVAEHIVLSQRFDLANAAPNKADGDAPPPLGYRLSTTTRMTVDVYNFNLTPQTIELTGRAFGGWTVRPTRQTGDRITVPPKGRTSVEFAVVAGKGVHRGVDYPLVFEAKIPSADGDRNVPPSVSRIQRRSRRRGTPIPLAPSITRLTPADGATVDGPDVRVAARITDALSGVDEARADVEVDGRRAPCHYDPTTGRLTAALHLRPGRHEIWVRAYNKAHAPAQASVTVTVRP